MHQALVWLALPPASSCSSLLGVLHLESHQVFEADRRPEAPLNRQRPRRRTTQHGQVQVEDSVELADLHQVARVLDTVVTVDAEVDPVPRVVGRELLPKGLQQLLVVEGRRVHDDVRGLALLTAGSFALVRPFAVRTTLDEVQHGDENAAPMFFGSEHLGRVHPENGRLGQGFRQELGLVFHRGVDDRLDSRVQKVRIQDRLEGPFRHELGDKGQQIGFLGEEHEGVGGGLHVGVRHRSLQLSGRVGLEGGSF